MTIEELKKMEYEDLVQLNQDKKITLVEFINAQDDLCTEYAFWCKQHNAEQNEISASDFLDFCDQEMMDSQLFTF